MQTEPLSLYVQITSIDLADRVYKLIINNKYTTAFFSIVLLKLTRKGEKIQTIKEKYYILYKGVTLSVFVPNRSVQDVQFGTRDFPQFGLLPDPNNYCQNNVIIHLIPHVEQ